jgi:hypothetical protein
LNGVEWVIQSGWLNRMSITNSIFVNPFMYGYRARDVCREGQTYDDFLAGRCDRPEGSLFNVIPVDSFGFEVDFTDLERQIYVGYNNILYQDWFLDWMENCVDRCLELKRFGELDFLPQPYPPFGEASIAFMDSRDAQGNKVFGSMNVDTTTMYSVDPGFIEPATNEDTLKIFIEARWDDASTIDWSYKPDAGLNQVWPLPENMAYDNAMLQIAGMGGFPLGDLNWYPKELEDWEMQREKEWARINDLLEHGITTNTELIHELPAGYRLEQNYPNPFSTETRITYSLPATGRVLLRVYDLLGHVVATLVDGPTQAGTHASTFSGRRLSSGVYYYRLEGEHGVALSRKFMVVR